MKTEKDDNKTKQRSKLQQAKQTKNQREANGHSQASAQAEWNILLRTVEYRMVFVQIMPKESFELKLQIQDDHEDISHRQGEEKPEKTKKLKMIKEKKEENEKKRKEKTWMIQGKKKGKDNTEVWGSNE